MLEKQGNRWPLILLLLQKPRSNLGSYPIYTDEISRVITGSILSSKGSQKNYPGRVLLDCRMTPEQFGSTQLNTRVVLLGQRVIFFGTLVH